jgi:hypothetical protein
MGKGLSDQDFLLIIGILALASYGLGAAAYDAIKIVRSWWRGDKAKAAKPRDYQITIEDADGWPLRSYRMPVEATASVIRDLDRKKP